jgi:hypothetical protein
MSVFLSRSMDIRAVRRQGMKFQGLGESIHIGFISKSKSGIQLTCEN